MKIPKNIKLGETFDSIMNRKPIKMTVLEMCNKNHCPTMIHISDGNPDNDTTLFSVDHYKECPGYEDDNHAT